jgi:hypothetical protein
MNQKSQCIPTSKHRSFATKQVSSEYPVDVLFRRLKSVLQQCTGGPCTVTLNLLLLIYHSQRRDFTTLVHEPVESVNTMEVVGVPHRSEPTVLPARTISAPSSQVIGRCVHYVVCFVKPFCRLT